MPKRPIMLVLVLLSQTMLYSHNEEQRHILYKVDFEEKGPLPFRGGYTNFNSLGLTNC